MNPLAAVLALWSCISIFVMFFVILICYLLLFIWLKNVVSRYSVDLKWKAALNRPIGNIIWYLEVITSLHQKWLSSACTVVKGAGWEMWTYGPDFLGVKVILFQFRCKFEPLLTLLLFKKQDKRLKIWTCKAQNLKKKQGEEYYKRGLKNGTIK